MSNPLDITGQPIFVGSKVVFAMSGSKDFTTGVVIKVNTKTVKIHFTNHKWKDWQGNFHIREDEVLRTFNNVVVVI